MNRNGWAEGAKCQMEGQKFAILKWEITRVWIGDFTEELYLSDNIKEAVAGLGNKLN